MDVRVSKIGKRGTFVIPSDLRVRMGLQEGDLVIAEEQAEGLLLRPAIAVPAEIYSSKRKAEFLLTNAVSKEEYLEACEEVKRLSFDPKTIEHFSPFTTKR